MRTKHKTFQILLGLLLIVSGKVAFAGTETHGGGGFSCQQGTFLVDLYEATIPGEYSKDGLKVIRSNEEMIVQLEKALDKLELVFSKALRSEAEKRYKVIGSILKNVPQGSALIAPDDVDGEFMPSGCKLVGVASYNDAKERLLLDGSQYAKMPNTDQAALWLHESLYKFLRDTMGVQDSRLTRKVVGYLFSTATVVEVQKAFPSNLNLFTESLSKKSKLIAEVNSQISPVFFVRVNSACQGLVLVAPDLEFVVGNFGQITADFRSSKQINTTIGSQSSADPKCHSKAEFFDQFLRPRGEVAMSVDDDLLVTEPWSLNFVLRSSEWDFLADRSK